MEENKARLAIGSILHDTGKLLYRYNDMRNHSTSGYDFLKDIVPESEVLDCVRYHHSSALKNADVKNDALCYITYIADNIAAFSDRRKNETGEGGEHVSRKGFTQAKADLSGISPAKACSIYLMERTIQVHIRLLCSQRTMRSIIHRKLKRSIPKNSMAG